MENRSKSSHAYKEEIHEMKAGFDFILQKISADLDKLVSDRNFNQSFLGSNKYYRMFLEKDMHEKEQLIVTIETFLCSLCETQKEIS